MEENEILITDPNDPNPDRDRPLTKREKRQVAKEEKKQEHLKSEKTKKLKNWLIGLLVIIALFFGGYKAWKWISTPANVGSGENQSSILSARDSDWIKGNKEADLTLVEYGEFQCPACAIYSEIVSKLSNDYPNDLKVIYRHFPLPGHKNALPAAKAAEAAGRQGEFWQMHDLLYKNQEEWSGLSNPKDKFIEYAKSLGLDEEKYKSDFDSNEISDRISTDESEAVRLRINATPTFFLNGKKLGNIRGYDDFKGIIEAALSK